MRSKFKYYQQKGLAEFFNTIGQILPPPHGGKVPTAAVRHNAYMLPQHLSKQTLSWRD